MRGGHANGSHGQDDPEWRLHCEARHLLRLAGYRVVDGHGKARRVGPRQHRQQYLARVQASRGREARDRLAVYAWRLWEATAPVMEFRD